MRPDPAGPAETLSEPITVIHVAIQLRRGGVTQDRRTSVFYGGRPLTVEASDTCYPEEHATAPAGRVDLNRPANSEMDGSYFQTKEGWMPCFNCKLCNEIEILLFRTKHMEKTDEEFLYP